MAEMTLDRARGLALRESRKDYLLAVMAWDAGWGGSKAQALEAWKATVRARVDALMAGEA